MIYALNLSPDNRILSATFEQYAAPGQPIVDSLPDGNIADYLYVDGEYVYSPIPEPQPEPIRADRNYSAGELATIDGVMYEILTNIPAGVVLVERQNVHQTTIEEQLEKLKEQT